MGRPIFLLIAPLGAVLVQLPRCDLPIINPTPQCAADAYCNDEIYCNGSEHCVNGSCAGGEAPCAEALTGCASVECDEPSRMCVLPCRTDADCDDGLFCNGSEVCEGCECVSPGSPCSPDGLTIPTCDEEADRCVYRRACVTDADCEDGIACNGPEYCSIDGCSGLIDLEGLLEPTEGQLPGCFPCFDDASCMEGYACDSTTGACVASERLCIAQCPENAEDCCSVGNPACEVQWASSFGDFATTLLRWRDTIVCQAFGSFAVAGRCDDGSLVLYRSENEIPYGPIYITYYSPYTDKLFAMTTYANNGSIDDACSGRVDWPWVLECNLGTVTEVVCGARFSVGDALELDPCIAYCEPSWPYCPYQPVDTYANYDQTLIDWRSQATCTYYGPEQYYWRVAGRCDDGTQFVSDNSGLGSETRYFDPATREFRTLTTTSDLLDWVCLSRRYWPVRYSRENAVVTEVICPTAYEVGDSINLP